MAELTVLAQGEYLSVPFSRTKEPHNTSGGILEEHNEF